MHLKSKYTFYRAYFYSYWCEVKLHLKHDMKTHSRSRGIAVFFL